VPGRRPFAVRGASEFGDARLLVRGDDPRFDGCIAPSNAGAVRSVGGGIEVNAEKCEGFARRSAHASVVFADATGEDEGVDAAHGGGHARDGLADAVGVHVERGGGARVALVGGRPDVAKVVRTSGKSEDAGLAVEKRIELFEGDARTEEVEQDAGVDVAAARSHDEAFHGRESHGGVDADSVIDGGGTGAVAQVKGDDAHGRAGASELLRDTVGHDVVARSMEAITADAVLLVQLVREGVQVRAFREGGMEGGVEHGDVRGVRQRGARGVDAGEVGGVVEGRERREGIEIGENLVIEDDRFGVALPTMHHAVPDEMDVVRFGLLAERVEPDAEGGMDVFERTNVAFTAVAAQVRAQRVADALDGHRVVTGDASHLQARAAGVHDERWGFVGGCGLHGFEASWGAPIR